MNISVVKFYYVYNIIAYFYVQFECIQKVKWLQIYKTHRHLLYTASNKNDQSFKKVIVLFIIECISKWTTSIKWKYKL